MNLSSTYMGVEISNPVIISSSSLTSNVESVKKLADQGPGAIVLKSLFEEQIISDKKLLENQDDMYIWYQGAVDFLDDFIKKEGISDYLKLIEQSKKSVSVPIFASINCISSNKWPEIAAQLENSGADGLELNILISQSDMNQTGYQIEETYVDIIHEVRKNTKLPLSVKIGFNFSNLYRMLFKISNMEINSMVLFNRSFRPDIDIENLRVISTNVFSSPEEITQSLRWIAMLYPKAAIELIGATGVHDATGVIKQLLAGATSVQLCSTVYINGMEVIGKVIDDLSAWMKQKGYENLAAIRGLVSGNELNTPMFERMQFMAKTAGKIF